MKRNIKNYLSLSLVLTLMICTICYAVPANKIWEIYNNKPKTDLKASASAKKKLDIVAVTDLTGQKLSDFKNKVSNLKTNLFYKDVDAQINYIDENSLKQADVYKADKSSYDAQLNQDGTITFSYSGGLYGAYPNTGDPSTIPAPSGTFKIGSTGASVFTLTKDGNLYYTGSLQFVRSDSGVLWGINPSFTGFKLWSAGVKVFIASSNLVVILKKDGTVWWSGVGFLGTDYNSLITGGIAVSPNDQMAGRSYPGYTTTTEQIQGLNGITRIYAKIITSNGNGLPSVVAINDSTGEVYGWGWNKGQFGWHTPEYHTVASYFYSGTYSFYYHQPIEQKPKLIPDIDGRTIRDWILEDGFSYIYKKDNSLWEIDDNGFDLIYTNSGSIFQLPQNPYGKSVNWPGDTITPGTIYPPTYTKIAQLPSNVLRINHIGQTSKNVDTGRTNKDGEIIYATYYYDTFELYLDDSNIYTCDIPKSTTDPNYLNYSLLNSTSNYTYKSTYKPDSYTPYKNPSLTALKALNLDNIKGYSYRDGSDKVFLYVSENADTSNVYGGQVNVKTDVTGSVNKIEDFDSIHNLSYTQTNCTITTGGNNGTNCLYGYQGNSQPQASMSITINVPLNAWNAVFSFYVSNLDGYTAYLNGMQRSLSIGYNYISLYPGATCTLTVYTAPYTSGKHETFHPGLFAIDDLNVQYILTQNNQYGFGSYFPLLDINKDVLNYLADNNFKFYYVTPTSALDFLENYYGNQKYTLRQLGSVSDTMNVYTQQDDAMQGIYNAYVKNNPESNHIYVIANEEKVNYNKIYSDYESDPQKQERWKYEHNPTYFENSNGTASFNNQWLTNPIAEFDKVGRYTVTYQAQDAPTNETAFLNYNLWSTDEKQLIIDVHRRPIADFAYYTPTNTSVIDTTTNAEDFDNTHSLAYSIYNASVQGSGGVNNSKCLYAYSNSNYAYIQFQVAVPLGVTNAKVSFDAKGTMFYAQLDGTNFMSVSSGTVTTDYNHYEVNVTSPGTHTILIKTSSYTHGKDDRYTEFGYMTLDNITFNYSETNPARTLTFTNLSYDLDHMSAADKGIKATLWQWRNIKDTNWTSGLPTFIRNKDVYVVYLKVQDAEGAWSVPCIKVINGSAPSILIDPLSQNWTNQNVNVAITAQDNSTTGLKSLNYAVSSSADTPSTWTTKTYTSYVASDTVNLTLQNEGTWYVHAQANDCDDNSTTARGGTYNIDKTPPTITAIPSSGTINETNVNLTVSDALSGVRETWYCWDTSNTNKSGLTGFTNLSGSSITPPVNDGTYYLHVKSYDNANNERYMIYGPYVINTLTVAATVSPNPAKQGQKVTFRVNTTGYAKYLTLYFPSEIAALDASLPLNITILEEANHTEYVPYFLPLKTPTTIDRNGNRLRTPYTITAQAKKADGTTKTTTVSLDVKGSILDGIKTEINAN